MTTRATSDRAGGAPTRLPFLELQGDAGTVPLRAPQLGSTVLLLVRDHALERARAYIEKLEERLPDLRHWYGRPLLVTEATRASSALTSLRLAPPGWAALDIGAARSALIIADRWGMVYFATQTTTFTDLPGAAEVEEWLRYLATQCPECGVPDEPGHGEWAS